MTKKNISIILILATILTLADCTKKKKVIDVPGTIILYFLLNQSKPASSTIGNCSFRAQNNDTSTLYMCIDYQTGWTTSTLISDCSASGRGQDTTFSNATNSAISNASYVYRYTTGSACQSSTSGSCTITKNSTTAIVRLYSSITSTSAAQTFCSSVSGTYSSN